MADITQSHSQETLRRVKENDETLKTLWIGGTVHITTNRQGNEELVVRTPVGPFEFEDNEGVFNPSDDSEFSSLGEYVAENTHLIKLVHVDGRVGLDVECLRRNSSIHELSLTCDGHDISDGAIHDILQVYQEKKNLTRLYIDHANLRNGGDSILVNTLRGCTNLKTIILYRCGITGEQMLVIVEAIRGHNMLEELELNLNSIDNAGCGAIVTLLEDPNCNLQHLNLAGNNIDNDGAITIANSLANNTKLQNLDLYNNPLDPSVLEEYFCKVLCNTASVNDIYSSNHTLKCLDLPQQRNGDLLLLSLFFNEGTNKSHVAMKKILKYYPNMDMDLKYHPNIDMGAMFEWDAEEGESNLKALPHVISWFERANAAVAGEEGYNIEERKLDAIFQFARAMPLLFEGISAMDP